MYCSAILITFSIRQICNVSSKLKLIYRFFLPICALFWQPGTPWCNDLVSAILSEKNDGHVWVCTNVWNAERVCVHYYNWYVDTVILSEKGLTLFPCLTTWKQGVIKKGYNSNGKIGGIGRTSTDNVKSDMGMIYLMNLLYDGTRLVVTYIDIYNNNNMYNTCPKLAIYTCYIYY